MQKINNPFFGVMFFITIFLIRRLPFLINFSTPFVGRDTAGYFMKSELLVENVFISFGIYPPGFPVFIKLVQLFTLNPYWIIFSQIIITLSVSLFLIKLFYKYYQNVAFILTLLLSLYLTDSLSLLNDFSLLTDSLYMSSLLLVFGGVILVFKRGKDIDYCFLSTILFLPAIFRSNGIYIYFIFFLILFFFLIKKESFKKYLFFILPFLLLNFSWSAYNWKTENIFFPSNPERIMGRITNIDEPDKFNPKKNSEPKFIKHRIKLIKEYIGSPIQNREDVYSYYAINNYERLYLNRNQYFSFSEKEKVIFPVLLNVYNEPSEKHSNYYKKLKNEETDFVMKINNVYNYFYNIFMINYLWVFLFLISFFMAIYLIIKNKFKDNELSIILILSLMQILSIIVLSLAHGRALPRYIHVSEFAIYFTPILLFYYLYKKRCFNKFFFKTKTLFFK